MPMYEVATLDGELLNHAVHKALEEGGHEVKCLGIPGLRPYCTDWSVGGPLIEQHHIMLGLSAGALSDGWTWEAQAARLTPVDVSGPAVLPWQVGETLGGRTALVAAMRALVAAHAGNHVELPM